MAKIPFSDPIWARLYGPYGNQSGPQQLQALAAGWDQDAANALYWDQLHHQETLYPLTYAALPWLWDLAPRTLDNLYFFSHTVSCALSNSDDWEDAPDPQRRLTGLSLDASRHAQDWLPAAEHLSPEDMGLLASLERWFLAAAPNIAEAALAGLDAANTLSEIAVLCSAHCSLSGCYPAFTALEMMAEKEPDEFLLEELGALDQRNRQMLLTLAGRMQDRHPDHARNVRAFARHPGHGEALVERDPGTADMFA
ncbi:hypothetical protein [Leisingera sp. ANG-M6]|uniref:hypothetical protein n=1 Tax=Leisingera sp. ANG-M6 TaxID=1577900 RepID=UPI00068C6619|nr:hypothetical protein [Leisingera sp. ANG-M6]